MRIKLIKTTPVDGVVIKAGKTVDASTSDARFLIAIGKAEPCQDKPPKKAPAKKKAPENKSVPVDELETR